MSINDDYYNDYDDFLDRSYLAGDDSNYPEDDGDEYSPEELYSVEGCYEEASTFCECCGVPICSEHHEVGAGFCKNCPKPGWTPDYPEEGEKNKP